MSPIRLPAVLFGLVLLAISAVASDWLPVTREELEMTESHEKGAHAVILYREMVTDDVQGFQLEYYRIKILSDEGKKFGNIEIPFMRHHEVGFGLGDIRARTIRPDGSIVPFNGPVFEKILEKGKHGRYFAKTFSMPEVQKGSIIEYKFAQRWVKYWLVSTRWTIQSDMPIRKLYMRRRPSPEIGMNWSTYLPAGTNLKKDPQGNYILEMENVPALQSEPWMPPEDLYKFHVQFIYTYDGLERVPERFWERMGKRWSGEAEKFIGERSEIRQIVQQLVAAGDTPEAKLRKLYAHVQQLQNLNYEREKVEKEQQREKRKPNSNVADVLERGYGSRNELTRLFVAMARAAGFEASVIRVSNRKDLFFNVKIQDSDQLREEIAVVRVDGAEMYFDPGTRFCPFGILAWPHTMAKGLRLHKDGATFIETPVPKSTDALTERKATLKLAEDGSAEGTLLITMTGREALDWRLATMESDNVGRRKQMEKELLRGLPEGVNLEVKQISGWENGEEPLRAEASLRLAGFGAFTGRRWLLPLGLFQVSNKNPFQLSERKFPVYFPYTFKERDEVTLELPPSFVVETLPPVRNHPSNMGQYEIRAENRGRTVVVKRNFSVDGVAFNTEYYPIVRMFFTTMRAGDENQLVLRKTEISHN